MRNIQNNYIMNRVILFISFLAITPFYFSQNISSVSPNSGERGTTSLPITISGSGTNFSMGTFTNASYSFIRFRQGTNLLLINNVTSISDTEINLDLSISNTDNLGGYWVEVWDNLVNNFITLQNGFTVVNFNSIKTEENNKNILHTFPNPNNGNLNIEIPENIKTYSLVIYNQQGQKVWSKENSKRTSELLNIDLNFLSSGVYFLNLVNENSVFESKIIKY